MLVYLLEGRFSTIDEDDDVHRTVIFDNTQFKMDLFEEAKYVFTEPQRNIFGSLDSKHYLLEGLNYLFKVALELVNLGFYYTILFDYLECQFKVSKATIK